MPWQDVNVNDMLLPGDAQQSAEAAQIKGIKPVFLSGVGGEHGVVPHSFCQTGHRFRFLADPYIQLCFEGMVLEMVDPRGICLPP